MQAYSFPRRKNYQIKTGSYRMNLGTHTKIMGIINLTPDSFSQDGYLANTKDGLRKTLRLAQTMIKQGADIIDLGGESTRPGSKPISAKEEINRVIPALKVLAKKVHIPISVDTYKPEVALRALDNGAAIINNIKGTKLDKDLLKMTKNYKAAIVLMHMRGVPLTMQINIHYRNLIQEIIQSLKKSIENCLDIGIKSDKIIIDPGIGFGKTVAHNLEILNHLQTFAVLNQPILVGTSRKSFLGKILNKNIPDRLWGTLASACASIMRGAHIIRVHDVAETKETALVTDAIINQTNHNPLNV